MGDTVSQCIEKPTRWAIHELKPLPFYFTGRVVLLGDAVCGILRFTSLGWPTKLFDDRLTL